MAAVDCSHQREGEVEDVAVEQRALLLQQHSQQLDGRDEAKLLVCLTADLKVHTAIWDCLATV